MTFQVSNWIPVYNSFVLTVLLLTQIYLAFAIAIAQRRQIKERRDEAKKAVTVANLQTQASGEHSTIRSDHRDPHSDY